MALVPSWFSSLLTSILSIFRVKPITNDPTVPSTDPTPLPPAPIDWKAGTVNILALISAAIPVLKIFTGDKVDKMLDMINTQLANPDFLNLIETIINSFAVRSATGEQRTALIVSVANQTATPELKNLLDRLGFKWEDVLTYLPDIIRIILSLLKLR